MILLVKIRESNSVKAVKETGYWFSPSTCGWGDFLIASGEVRKNCQKVCVLYIVLQMGKMPTKSDRRIPITTVEVLSSVFVTGEV